MEAGMEVNLRMEKKTEAGMEVKFRMEKKTEAGMEVNFRMEAKTEKKRKQKWKPIPSTVAEMCVIRVEVLHYGPPV